VASPGAPPWVTAALKGGADLASAILVLYATEGFLVAADGRMRMDGVVKSDSITKIFSIAQPGRSLCYAFGGSVGLTDKDDPEIVLFDFREEAIKIIESFARKQHPDLLSYGTELSMKLCGRLLEAQSNDRLEKFKAAEKSGEIVLIACMFLGGYYNGQPSLICAQFMHKDQVILTPTVSNMSFAKKYEPCLLYGSEVVRKLLFQTNDPAFSDYRVPPDKCSRKCDAFRGSGRSPKIHSRLLRSGGNETRQQALSWYWWAHSHGEDNSRRRIRVDSPA